MIDDGVVVYKKGNTLCTRERLKLLVPFGAALLAFSSVVVVFLVTTAGNTDRLRFTLDNVTSGTLQAKRTSGRFVENGTAYLTSDSKAVYRHDIASNTRTTLYEFEHPYERSFESSEDGRKLLLISEREAVWGRQWSFVATYTLYDTQSKEHALVASKVQAVRFISRDRLAYCKGNNVFVDGVQLTFDGEASGLIVNGVQSWVYEEEIFSSRNALFPSVDGGWLAFLRFNHSALRPFPYDMWSKDYPWPEQVKMQYPFPGYPNPLVSVVVVEVGSSVLKRLEAVDELVVGLSWSPSSKLLVVYSNRQQTRRSFVLYDPTSKEEPSVALVQEAQFGWFEPISKVSWPEDGTFCFLAADYGTDKMRLGCSDLSGNLQFVSPEWAQVEEVVGFFGSEFVLRVAHPTPLDRSVWKCDATGKMTQISPDASGFFDVEMSPTGESFFLHFSGNGMLSMPWSKFVSTSGTIILEDNLALFKKMEAHALPLRKFTTVQIGSESLNAVAIVPSNFTSSSRYDVLMNVYGGPNSQLVSLAYGFGFNEYLVEAHDVIVAIVDNRGTGGRGLKFLMSHTHKRLGLAEIEDQASFAAWLKACLGVTHASRVFSSVVAVAPVVDWRFYDSVYTERYMGLLQSNLAGYNATSVLNRNLALIGETPFLLLHGLADDNVHFGNSAVLDWELVSNDM